MMAIKKPLYEDIADRLIQALEKGTSPFQKPWSDDNRLFELPYNPVTEKPYRGLNSFGLAMLGEEDPRWMTYKQAQSMGWQVEKGAKSQVIHYYSNSYDKVKTDENKRPVLDENGNKVKVKVLLNAPIMTSANVFNAKDIKGIPPIELKEVHEWDANKDIDKLIRNSGVKLSHGGNNAFYSPIADRIQMPQKQQFPSPQNYYSILMHELGHWTGHETRLNRPMIAQFGTIAYAKEELRAEIASLMIESKFNLPHNFENHAAYVQSWVKILKDDPMEIMKASADAQKITDYVMGFQHKRVEKQSAEVTESLMLNDKIEYKDNQYIVKGLLPNRRLQLMDVNNGKSFVLRPDDGLYNSLVNAKIEASTEKSAVKKNLSGQQNTIETNKGQDESLDNGLKFKR